MIWLHSRKFGWWFAVSVCAQDASSVAHKRACMWQAAWSCGTQRGGIAFEGVRPHWIVELGSGLAKRQLPELVFLLASEAATATKDRLLTMWGGCTLQGFL